MYEIMLVDDLEIFRRKIKRMKLWNNSYSFLITQEAGDGAEAIEKLRKHRVDVVITDIKMPKINGIELLKVIRQENLADAVILLSDYTEYEYAREGIIQGAFDYIGKTTNEEELRDILKRLEGILCQKVSNNLSKQKVIINKDLEKMTELILSGDMRATVMIETIFNSRFSVTSCQCESRYILEIRDIWNQLIERIVLACPWIIMYSKFEIYIVKDDLLLYTFDEIIEEVIQYVKDLVKSFQIYLPCYGETLIKNTCFYILTHVNERYSVTDVAKKMFVSKSHLSEQFKKNTGMTLVNYITLVKMERAKILLRTTNLRYSEIAYQLGYQYSEYFSKVFKKYVGISLTEYRVNSKSI